MKIEDVNGGKNALLFQEVESHYKVVLEPVSKGKSWTSEIRDGKAVVGWYRTMQPHASFAHELLHFKTQSLGYKQLKTALTTDSDIFPHLEGIVDMLDNEFQHHRMCKFFELLGYSPKVFYADNGKSVVAALKKHLAIYNQILLSIGLHYLSVIAPCGRITAADKDELKESFRKYNGGKFAESFDTIDDIFIRWSLSGNYDAQPYIKEFVEVLTTESIWFGYTLEVDKFPHNGFFVNQGFDLVNAC